jgi:hypothetical protein
MRLSLAITGLAAIGAQAACKGRSEASSSSSNSTAAASTTGVDATAKASASSTSSSVAAASSTAASNVKVASTSTTKTAANNGIKGFNYGAFFLNYQAAVQNDFEYEFEKAANLPDTSGWNSARLYTMGKLYTAGFVGRAWPSPLILHKRAPCRNSIAID